MTRITKTLTVVIVAVAGVAVLRRSRAAVSPGASRGVLDAAGVRQLYDRVAPFYDLLTAPYRWIGTGRIVDEAIRQLRLRPGDTVVDLGTGTGRNLVALSNAVGPDGHVVGVDLSPQMLQRARARATAHQLSNVELVEGDIATFRLPPVASGVIATYAIEMLPDYDDVIARLVNQMPDEGRIALVGLRDPAAWPEWLIWIGSAINRPFGVSKDYRSHRPWEAIQLHTTDSTYTEAFAGAVYLAAGTTRSPHPAPSRHRLSDPHNQP